MATEPPLEKAYRDLKRDLDIGTQIHEALLLGQLPKGIVGLDVAVSTLPSKGIDGDFFEFYAPSGDRLDIVLGDVMGKGIAAALMGSVIKTQLVRFAMPPALPLVFDKKQGWHEAILDIEDILSRVQGAVSSELIKLEYFVSLIYGRFDLRKRIFSFVDCGFTKPIHFKKGSQESAFLKGENFPLGMVPQDIFQRLEVTFEEGDAFLFYSDGIIEARSKSGEFFGRDRLQKLLLEHQSESAATLSSRLLSAAKSFQQEEDFQDDLSLIVVKIGPLPHFEPIERNFRGDLSELQTVRDYVYGKALEAGSSEVLARELALAINEIFCNIVEHGLKGAPSPILIALEPTEGGMSCLISDQGEPFQPLQRRFSEVSARGHGWKIIQKLIDQATYVPKSGPGSWNRLKLFKKETHGN